jgi:hypothetical protein
MLNCADRTMNDGMGKMPIFESKTSLIQEWKSNGKANYSYCKGSTNNLEHSLHNITQEL